MITTTLDPISLNDVEDVENAPYIIEGEGANALKIYFESEQNKQEYLDTPLHGSDDMAWLKKIYDDMADNPNTGSIN
jgi:YHS domain-containing protein